MAKIVFVNPTHECRITAEVNGTLLLGTKLLQADFDVEVLRFCDIDNFGQDYSAFIHEYVQQILIRKPDAVSFYCMWTTFHIMLRLARELKAVCPGIITVMGGPPASAAARPIMDAMDYIDYICSGEGENTVVPFFDALLRQNGKGLEQVPGLYYRRNGQVNFNDILIPLCDLNTLPQWDDRLYQTVQDNESAAVRSSNHYYMNVEAGRGCPFRCTFCTSSRFWRRSYRLKTPERIVEDITYYNKKFGIRSFAFCHDAFTTNRKLVMAVCDEIQRSGLDITWGCTSRVDCIDEELILKMKQSGMDQIELGIETGSPRMQKLVKKNLNLDNAAHMVDFMVKNDILVNLFFIYGFPEETTDDLQMTLNLLFNMIDQGVNSVSLSFLRFNPQSEMTKQYFDELVFDPTVTMLPRGFYGYNEEVEIIKAHKAIFPFFYHLETPVRRQFQHLNYLAAVYRKLPEAGRMIRKLYSDDPIRMYHDFIRCNQECFDSDHRNIAIAVNRRPAQLFGNMLPQFHLPYEKQLRSLMDYQFDCQSFKRAKKDSIVQHLYHFSYSDLQNNVPIEEYSEGQILVRFEIINGKHKKQIIPMG